jgi:hypothetical protein
METEGIDGLLVETHNWGKTVAFWQGLGFKLEFETDHHSGRLRHPRGGLYIFVAERPPEHKLQVMLGLRVESATDFKPPASGTVTQPFTKTHWGTLQMLLADPDGRALGIEAPLHEKASPGRTEGSIKGQSHA